jgi:hypothetical protein
MRNRKSRAQAPPAILREVRKLRDWMVERDGFELATPRSVVLGKLSATLAQFLGREKGSSAGENLIAGNSPPDL